MSFWTEKAPEFLRRQKDLCEITASEKIQNLCEITASEKMHKRYKL